MSTPTLDQLYPESGVPEQEAAPAAESAEAAATESAPAAEAAPDKQPEAVTAPEGSDDGGEADEGSAPTDFEGFKKALAAARGDKRKMRAKWQEADRKLAMLEGELQALRAAGTAAKQTAAAKPEPAPNSGPTQEELEAQFLADPVGTLNRLKEEIRQGIHSEYTKRDIAREEARMERQHADFGQARSAFIGAAQNMPQLWGQMQASPDPVAYAYEVGKMYLEAERLVSDVGDDPAAYRERVRQEVLAELQAQGGQAGAAQKPKPPIPRSNASARGGGVGVGAAPHIPTPAELYDR